jgi:TPR repeat protein
VPNRLATFTLALTGESRVFSTSLFLSCPITLVVIASFVTHQSLSVSTLSSPALAFPRAVCAYNGAGMDKDLLLARTLFTRAAAAGHPAAMTNLALCLYRGEGGGRDPSQAVALLRKACSFGLPQAQYQLGLLYFRSKQAKVRTEGTALLQRAAAQGFAGAHATLQQLAASKSRQGNSRAVPSHPTGTVRTANTNSNDGSMDSESSDSGSNPSTDKGTSKRLAQTSRDSSDNNADKAAPPTKRPHRTSPSPSTSTANPLVPRSFPAGYSLGPFRGAPAGFGFPAGFPLMHNAVGGSYPPAAQAPQPKQAAFAKQLQQQLASAGVLVDGLVPSIPALHQCVLLSSSGDTNSMFIVAVLALCLRCGLSDMTMGAELSRRAGEAGHPAAAWVYSLCLREGMGVEANVRLAETYASLAVSAGFLPPAGMT